MPTLCNALHSSTYSALLEEFGESLTKFTAWVYKICKKWSESLYVLENFNDIVLHRLMKKYAFKRNTPFLHSKRFRDSFTFLHILVVISKTIVVSHSQVYSQCKYILVNFTASRITLENCNPSYWGDGV